MDWARPRAPRAARKPGGSERDTMEKVISKCLKTVFSKENPEAEEESSQVEIKLELLDISPKDGSPESIMECFQPVLAKRFENYWFQEWTENPYMIMSDFSHPETGEPYDLAWFLKNLRDNQRELERSPYKGLEWDSYYVGIATYSPQNAFETGFNFFFPILRKEEIMVAVGVPYMGGSKIVTPDLEFFNETVEMLEIFDPEMVVTRIDTVVLTD